MDPKLHFLLLTPITLAGHFSYAADYLNVAQAQKLIFPQATSFESAPITLTSEQKRKIEKISGVRQRNIKQEAWKVLGAKGLDGYFVLDEVIGKHEYITYGVGISNDGKVVGVEILSYRETHGGQIREAGWRDNFKGKTVNDSFKLDVDVPNISGATLSCRNVLDGVKRVLSLFQVAIQNG